jgi:acetyltransferase-like isoleucine patch superfamily enzyme
MKEFIKVLYFRLKYKASVKKNCIISFDSTMGNGCVLEEKGCISSSTLGCSVYIGNNSRLFKVEVGSYTSIGPNVTIGENEHYSTFISTSNFLLNDKMKEVYVKNNKVMTSIGSDVWIGIGATIKKGVRVGHGAIVGAHALVTKDIEPYSVVGGVPAKIIKYRFNEFNINRLLQSNWWELNEKILDNVFDNIELKDEDGMCDDFIEQLIKFKILSN